MFIKFKPEPQCVKALPPLKEISYFSIDDDATVINLKMMIENYVDVPAERQEIRTLTKVFQNNWLLKEVCDVRGSSIMLYAYDESYEHDDAKFVCFLQIYTNELAAHQQELEQQSKKSIPPGDKVPTSKSSSSVTVIDDSETEDNSEASDTDTSSSKSVGSGTESGCSTDSSDSSCGKKRSKCDKQNAVQSKKLKAVIPTGGQYSEALCRYLDEFPKCSNHLNAVENETSSKLSLQTTNNSKLANFSPNDSRPNNTVLKKEIIVSGNKQSATIVQNAVDINSENSKNTSNIMNKIQSDIITTTKEKSNSINNKHPCYFINPEIRDHLAIIYRTDKTDINNAECEKLLVWFFDRFRACDSSSALQFDSKTAISLFEGKLWIACLNTNTLEWISENISKHCLKSYKILPLKEPKYLCEVVVPVVTKSKNVLDIFDLLEKQNKGVVTVTWSLQKRLALSVEDTTFVEKSVSTFCTNELFHITMDEESRKHMQNLGFKLKYCFWEIVFKFM